MKPILILQHQTAEHPAYLKHWLEIRDYNYQIFNAGAGDEFPASIEPYSALAVLGGGMSANDPLLSNRQAEILILQAMRLDRPVIGHCLGGQLMTRALGGSIGPSPSPEIGWQPIDYADDPLVEYWFGDRPTPQVIQWHYESFSIPQGAVLLASSRACPNQAWALGRKFLAMQFHIEINQTKAHEWAADTDAKWDQARARYDSVQTSQQIIEGVDQYLDQHLKTADHIYQTWLKPTIWANYLST